MFRFGFLARFGSALDSWSMVTILQTFTAAGRDFLLSGSSAFGRYNVLDLDADIGRPLTDQTVTGPSGVFALSDAALVSGQDGLRLYSATRHGSQIDVQAVGADGRLSVRTPLQTVDGVHMEASVLEAIQVGGTQYLAVAAHDRATLDLLRLPASGGGTAGDASGGRAEDHAERRVGHGQP